MPKFDFTDEAKKTSEGLANEIAQLTKLTSKEIEKFFPTVVEKQRLAELLTIVRAATSRNEKIAKLRKNISTLGESVVKLIEVLA